MNTLVLIIQMLLIAFFSLGALKLGREALMSWVTIQALLANLFVLKQIRLFSLDITCSDAFAIGSILGLNLIQEFYNKQTARNALHICFFFLLFFAIMASLHLVFIPSPYDSTHTSYQLILQASPRLLLASLSCFLIVQSLDLHFFSYLRRKIPSFFARNFFTITLSQALDTILFSFLGLYGLVESLWDIILVSFLLKTVIIFSLASLTSLSKKFIKQSHETLF